MQQRRRWASAGWLLAVPVLIGTVGGVAPLATALALLAAALVTVVALWRSDPPPAGGPDDPAFRALVSAGSDPVLVLDGDLRVTWAAPALRPTAPAGRPLADVLLPEDADAVCGWLAGAAPAGLRNFRLRDDAEHGRVFEAAVSDLRGDADVRALVLHCRDVTVRSDREHELSSLAFIDPLTGLPNRAAQRMALDRELAELDASSGEDVALLVIEVQGLREAGEHAGRHVVDVALTELAHRLRATVRGEDQVARIGTDLFSVLAHGSGTEPDKVAARCLAVVEAPIPTTAGIVDLTAAVGLAPLVPGLTEHTALDRAELALGDARAAGAGSVRRYRDELAAARDRREQLRRDLVGARDRGELGLVWQPIVALADHRITGVEALLRWEHPLYGDVPPEEFLPLAARAGLVVELQRWMLHTATATAATLPEPGLRLTLGVNVSAQHVAAGTLVGDVASALRDSGLSPERLVVELAEATLTREGIADDVTALRLMGVRLALDDFGRGASSLPGLGRLPVDVIKLDRALLSRVDRDPYARAMCEAVVSLGTALGIHVVAEGVETASQLGALRALGCGFAQGFLLSRPVGLEALERLLESADGRLWPGIVGRVDAP